MGHYVKTFYSAITLLTLLCCTVLRGQSSNEVNQYFDQGHQALAAGHLSEAEQDYVKLQKLAPASPDVYVALGLIYFQEAKYEQAIPALTHALKLKPGVSKVEALLAMSLSELTRYQEALPGLEKCFHLSTDAEVKRMCGLQLERADSGLHRDRKAVETALEMDRLYPDDPEVLYHSGRIYGNLAFLSVQRLAEIAPNSLWKQQAVAEAYESHGDTQAAIDAYHSVLALDPRRAGIHYRIGRTLLAHSRESNSPAETTSALNEFNQELEIDPSNGNAAYEIAEIYRTNGNLDQAVTYFDMALNHYPKFGEAHLGIAAVLIAQHKPDVAVSHLRQAIALDATNEVAWYRLSRAENMLGNRAEQEEALAKFKRLRSSAATEKQDRLAASPDEITRQQLDPNAQP